MNAATTPETEAISRERHLLIEGWRQEALARTCVLLAVGAEGLAWPTAWLAAGAWAMGFAVIVADCAMGPPHGTRPPAALRHPSAGSFLAYGRERWGAHYALARTPAEALSALGRPLRPSVVLAAGQSVGDYAQAVALAQALYAPCYLPAADAAGVTLAVLEPEEDLPLEVAESLEERCSGRDPLGASSLIAAAISLEAVRQRVCPLPEEEPLPPQYQHFPVPWHLSQ